MTEGSSVYEDWVLALRAWAKDPRTDLSVLPRLTADSLPPAAYERLIAHITSAQQEVMSTWQSRLERNLNAARSESDYARALVELRTLLARRLQLARHPGFPDQIRKPLSEAIERDVRRIQEDLERAVTSSRRGGLGPARERLLRLVRANSFVAILAPNFPLESVLRDAPTSPPDDPSTLQPTPAMPRTIEGGWARHNRRRVIGNDDQ